MNDCGPHAERLEQVFRRIQRVRMTDVPLLNPRLDVEAFGFRATPVGCVGILITPWFINLVRLPRPGAAGSPAQEEAVGRKTLHLFPAGRFEFIISHEPELGPFEMCSLFSPVLEFTTQETARHAARSALDALFTAPRAQPPPPHLTGLDDPWSPDGLLDSDAPLNITRRNLLFGGRRSSASGNPAP